MIGGDAPYDHEGGDGPADGPSPQPPQAPQAPPPSQPSQSPQPLQPPEIDEPAARADPLPPPDPAPAPPSPEPTGDERVDTALARFDELTAAPVADHVEVFEDVHRRLQDVLASVDHEERSEAAAPEEPSDGASRPQPAPQPEPQPAPQPAPRPGQAPGPRPGPPNWGS
jgi:hypothetical protein